MQPLAALSVIILKLQSNSEDCHLPSHSCSSWGLPESRQELFRGLTKGRCCVLHLNKGDLQVQIYGML